MPRAILLTLTLLLAACSPPSRPPAPEAGSAADNVIGAPLEQSLDKARSVDNLSGQRKEGLDEAIDAEN